MQTMRLTFLIIVYLVFGCTTAFANPAHVIPEEEHTYIAQVISLEDVQSKNVPNLDEFAPYTTVRIKFLDGPFEGRVQEVTEGGFTFSVGDKVYVRYIKTFDGSEYYSVQEHYRLPGLFAIIVMFILAVIFFGGRQGILSVFALLVSSVLVFTFLFPHIIGGINIIALALGGALFTLLIAMLVTHGFSRLTFVAFTGCFISVMAILIFAKYAVALTALTGFSTEESVYLNIATNGDIQFISLLIAGMLVGAIGVLDDITVTQASVVAELMKANSSLSRKELYYRAVKVGRNHTGAVINTLILAYAGASLPLVLLFYTSTAPTLELINREVIATEIVRSVVGSIGLLLAVPITTLLAVFFMKGEEVITTHPHKH